eukprot:scaffold8634_cov115-Isochrysis_galbana.AAC.11
MKTYALLPPPGHLHARLCDTARQSSWALGVGLPHIQGAAAAPCALYLGPGICEERASQYLAGRSCTDRPHAQVSLDHLASPPALGFEPDYADTQVLIVAGHEHRPTSTPSETQLYS